MNLTSETTKENLKQFILRQLYILYRELEGLTDTLECAILEGEISAFETTYSKFVGNVPCKSEILTQALQFTN